jgi:hypothetical protein
MGLRLRVRLRLRTRGEAVRRECKNWDAPGAGIQGIKPCAVWRRLVAIPCPVLPDDGRGVSDLDLKHRNYADR